MTNEQRKEAVDKIEKRIEELKAALLKTSDIRKQELLRHNLQSNYTVLQYLKK
jgi:hypothetical protein